MEQVGHAIEVRCLSRVPQLAWEVISDRIGKANRVTLSGCQQILQVEEG